MTKTHNVPAMTVLIWLLSSWKDLANPKSAICARNLESKRILLAFMSLWTILVFVFSWRKTNPSAVPIIISYLLSQFSSLPFLESVKFKITTAYQFFHCLTQRKSNATHCRNSSLGYPEFEMYYLPNIKQSRLLFGKKSYTRRLSGPEQLHPNNLTRFLCSILLIMLTSL